MPLRITRYGPNKSCTRFYFSLWSTASLLWFIDRPVRSSYLQSVEKDLIPLLQILGNPSVFQLMQTCVLLHQLWLSFLIYQ